MTTNKSRMELTREFGTGIVDQSLSMWSALNKATEKNLLVRTNLRLKFRGGQGGEGRGCGGRNSGGGWDVLSTTAEAASRPSNSSNTSINSSTFLSSNRRSTIRGISSCPNIISSSRINLHRIPGDGGHRHQFAIVAADLAFRRPVPRASRNHTATTNSTGTIPLSPETYLLPSQLAPALPDPHGPPEPLRGYD